MEPESTRDTAAKLEAARASLADLAAMRDALLARKDAMAAERQQIAHAALAEGNAAAKRKLDKLSSETGTTNLDLENLSAAIAGAESRVKQAEQADARAVEIQRATQARQLVADRERIAKIIEDSLLVLNESYGLFLEAGTKLGDVTRQHVNPRFDSLALENAFYTAMMSLTTQADVRDGNKPLRFERPDSQLRKPMSALQAQGDATHIRWVNRILGPSSTETSKAA